MIDLQIVEAALERPKKAIAAQREAHANLQTAQGTYDLSQQETQESLKDLKEVLAKVGD